MLFAVNGGVTVGLLPILITGHGSITTVLGYWAIAAFVACLWSYGALVLLARNSRQVEVNVSVKEGLLTIPALVGTFLLIFLARYILGLNSNGATLATFSISSMITESAFLISVSLIGIYSNRIMDGEHPNRSLMIAVPTLLMLTLLGLVVIEALLPYVGGSEYTVSVPVTLILALAGISRLFISAWKSRAVAHKRVQASAWVYMVVAMLMTGLLLVWSSSHMVIYAVTLTIAFMVVALYQWTTVRTKRNAKLQPL
jgi:hypothetical protein